MSKFNHVRESSYYIVMYDVNEKRVQRVHKVLKQYLTHKQNSVFIGTLKKSEVLEIEGQLENLIQEGDKVCFMVLKSSRDLLNIELGENDKIDDKEIFF